MMICAALDAATECQITLSLRDHLYNEAQWVATAERKVNEAIREDAPPPKRREWWVRHARRARHISSAGRTGVAAGTRTSRCDVRLEYACSTGKSPNGTSCTKFAATCGPDSTCAIQAKGETQG